MASGSQVRTESVNKERGKRQKIRQTLPLQLSIFWRKAHRSSRYRAEEKVFKQFYKLADSDRDTKACLSIYTQSVQKIAYFTNLLPPFHYQFIIDGSSPDPGSLDPSRSVEMWGITKFRPKKFFGRVLHFQKCTWDLLSSFLELALRPPAWRQRCRFYRKESKKKTKNSSALFPRNFPYKIDKEGCILYEKPSGSRGRARRALTKRVFVKHLKCL